MLSVILTTAAIEAARQGGKWRDPACEQWWTTDFTDWRKGIGIGLWATRRHSFEAAELDGDGDNYQKLNDGERGVVGAVSKGTLSERWLSARAAAGVEGWARGGGQEG
jgi:hypothetical protein